MICMYIQTRPFMAILFLTLPCTHGKIKRILQSIYFSYAHSKMIRNYVGRSKIPVYPDTHTKRDIINAKSIFHSVLVLLLLLLNMAMKWQGTILTI